MQPQDLESVTAAEPNEQIDARERQADALIDHQLALVRTGRERRHGGKSKKGACAKHHQSRPRIYDPVRPSEDVMKALEGAI